MLSLLILIFHRGKLLCGDKLVLNKDDFDYVETTL